MYIVPVRKYSYKRLKNQECPLPKKKSFFSLFTAVLLTIILSLLAAAWQFKRYREKKEILNFLKEHLSSPRILAPKKPFSPDEWQKLRFSLVRAKGVYDFKHEMTLINRMHNGKPGVLLLTPFKVRGTVPFYILVQRGFVPIKFASPEQRKRFFRSPISLTEITALVREGRESKYWLAPQDPDPKKIGKWVDKWLRVDIKKIQKQLPYKIAPYYLEIVPTSKPEKLIEMFFHTEAGKDELFLLTNRASGVMSSAYSDNPKNYPAPMLSTELPPGRHLGYVFEWLFIAGLLAGTAFLSHLRSVKQNPH